MGGANLDPSLWGRCCRDRAHSALLLTGSSVRYPKRPHFFRDGGPTCRARARGTDGLCDSPLEGDGFEPSALCLDSSVSAGLAPSVAADLHPYSAPLCTPASTESCNENLCIRGYLCRFDPWAFTFGNGMKMTIWRPANASDARTGRSLLDLR